MEWFAVTSAVTTSLAWAGADARARGAWVSLADVCRQTMTEGRIRDGRTQMHRVCRLARVVVADLRAAIDAGLVIEDGDDVVLIGWDHSKEREALRAVQRARESRQRQRQHADGDEVVVPTAPNETASELPPFANAPPHADPNFGTEKRREEKTREETPPPSPQDMTGDPPCMADGSHAASAATALGHLPESMHEPRENPADPVSLPSPVHSPNESPRHAQHELPRLGPTRSRRDAHPALRSAALADHALGIVVALGGCLRGPGGMDYTLEWQRELSGTDAREVLALCLTAREPIRLPSGLRREREVWRQLPSEERRSLVHQVCAAHDIPVERRPPALEQPS